MRSEELGVRNSCDKREQLSLLELTSEARIKNEVNNDMLHIIVVDNNSNEELGMRNEELWSTVNRGYLCG